MYKSLFYGVWPHGNVKHGRPVCALPQSCSHGNSLSREMLKKTKYYVSFLLKNGFSEKSED